jgi:nifR3 family TIM-barrel protein
MMTFGPDERPRSLQIYGSDPDMLGRAVHRVCDDGLVDHVDLNFGCPGCEGDAARWRRSGAGEAEAPPRCRARRGARCPSRTAFPVTAKFRMGLWDHLSTDIDTGTICAEEGVAWIALHARTVEQHYSGEASWDAIGELKHAVDGIPVLGNGDIWEAGDALEMMRRTGCDGVVIGRGCLGRPWLFGDIVRAHHGEAAAPARPLGVVIDAMQRHARLLADHYIGHGGEVYAMRDFRKHTSWYVSGYPVGPEVRRRCRRSRRSVSSTTSSVSSTRRCISSREASASSAATPTARSRSRSPSTSSTTATSS